MKLLLLNILAISIVFAPMVALELLRNRYAWLERHHVGLSGILWIICLAVLYLWFLPQFGLEANPAFFRH